LPDDGFDAAAERLGTDLDRLGGAAGGVVGIDPGDTRQNEHQQDQAGQLLGVQLAERHLVAAVQDAAE
jgi:hypothetical protein